MKERIYIGTLFLGILLGLITVFKVYTAGFTVYAKTDVLVWTMPVAAYIFFSLTSAGLAFVSSFPVVFGIKRYALIEKRTVFLEISVLLAAFTCLVLHLGSPWNAIYMVLSPNFSSPLWWLAIFYGIYLVILLASFWKMHIRQFSKPLNVLVFLLAVCTSTLLGWLVGMTDARPTLNPGFLTIFFPITAFASGLAAIMLLSHISAHFSNSPIEQDRSDLFNEIAKIFGITIGVTLVLLVWRMIIGGFSSSAVEFTAYRHMMGSVSFHVELWLGLALPVILMLVPSLRMAVWSRITASILFLMGMFAGRLEFILSGEIMPLGAMAEGRPVVVGYMPTIWEVFVALFGLSVMLLAYKLGERYLTLEEVPE
jgi:molybdopterin-containing oxidoreductase family membrane subunit